VGVDFQEGGESEGSLIPIETYEEGDMSGEEESVQEWGGVLDDQIERFRLAHNSA
jgi:uncharacterized protein affecting Mg2+/Co2+ transport